MKKADAIAELMDLCVPSELVEETIRRDVQNGALAFVSHSGGKRQSGNVPSR
tara:strand:- start:464 stop:619 length:156 start_codon:yes stop_codon:yes gene_type:complete